MELITDLLQRIVALLTSIVMSVTPMTDTMEVSLLDTPVYAYADYDVMPLSSSSFYGLGGSTLYSTSSHPCFTYRTMYGSRSPSIPSMSFSVGIPVSISTGSKVDVSFSGFSFGRCYMVLDPAFSSYALEQYTWMRFNSSLVVSAPFSTSGYSLVDQSSNIIASVSGTTGSYSFTADHDISYLGFSVTFDSYVSTILRDYYSWIDVSEASMTVTFSDPVVDSILGIYVAASDIAVSNRAILQAIQDLNSTVGTPSSMEQFENNYLDKMEDQLSRVDDMLGPENTALPNGGDFAGFVSDIQDGLGVSGSSFSASEFAAATSAFGGADATAPGGPWEFFSQAVADSLSGDTQTVVLNDDDYIYQWLDMIQGRYGLWSSSSP